MQMEYEVTKNQMTQNGWGRARASQDAGAAKTATQNAANSKVSCLTAPTRPTTPFPAGTHLAPDDAIAIPSRPLFDVLTPLIPRKCRVDDGRLAGYITPARRQTRRPTRSNQSA